MGRPKESWPKRFFKQVSPHAGPGCWEWQGARTDFNHGLLSILPAKQSTIPGESRHGIRAHRLAWILFRGEIPKGMLVCHKCDNPSCVRPDHLFLGTQDDNMKDAAKKNRMPKGTHHHNHLMTEDRVAELRKQRRLGLTYRELSEMFQIHLQTVAAIVQRRSWRHVE